MAKTQRRDQVKQRKARQAKVARATAKVVRPMRRVQVTLGDLIAAGFDAVGGEVKKVARVVKMRASQHSKAFREYEITERGFVVGGDLDGYTGRISGAPVLSRQEE